MISSLSASSFMFNTLIAIIFATIRPLQADYRVDQREFSLIKPYFSGRSFQFNWEYSGNVFITNEFIRLTPDETSKSGRLWSINPNPYKNWEAIIQFEVEGKGTTLFGDGIVFWYTKDRMTTGPVFGSKNNFNGLAIFLDTYSNHNGPHNHEHPYISAMISNGSLAYDHDRDGTHTQLAGCEAKFRKLTHDTFLAVKYENYVLTVSTDIENKNNWKPCFVVKGVRLPTNYYFGFSAATGDLSDSHKIISFRLYNIPSNDPNDFSNIVPSAEYFEVPRARVDDIKSSRWSILRIFLTFVVVAIILIAVAFAAVYYYQTKNERNMKRLY